MKGQLSFALLGLTAFVSTPSLAEYKPPAGVPAPSFGIEQTFDMYSSGALTKNGDLTYSAAGYTHYVHSVHYVDNRKPKYQKFTEKQKLINEKCSDDNEFGTKDKPRCSFPTAPLKEGSVVALFGGPYDSINLDGAKGTAQSPVFIRGEDKKTVLNGREGIKIKNSSYVILENLKTDGSEQSNKKSSWGLRISQPADHIAIRHSEATNYQAAEYCKDRMGGVGCWFSSVWAIGADKNWEGQSGINGRETTDTDTTQYDITDIVLYDNTITKNGSMLAYDSAKDDDKNYKPADYETGRHAISLSGGTKDIWILDNKINNNAEDGIQIFWYTRGSHGKVAENIYIGDNTITNNGENAVDVKQSKHVVISSNKVSGYKQTIFRDGAASGSDGAAIVLNDDSPSESLWVINNDISNSNLGIRSQSSGDIYISGNVIYDIERAPGARAPTSPGRGYGVAMYISSTRRALIEHNTIRDVDGGIYAVSGTELRIRNNIIADLNSDDGYLIAANDKNYETYKISKNLLDTDVNSDSEDMRLRGVKDCVGCLLGVNPKFKDDKYALMEGSLAIDAASVSTVDTAFDDLDDFDHILDNFMTDFNEKPRAKNGNIGAVGFMDPNAAAPAAPSGLTLTLLPTS